MCICLPLFAQNGDFFTPVSAPLELSQGRATFAAKIAADSLTKTAGYVKFSDLPASLATDGSLSLKVPAEEKTTKYFPVYYERSGSNSYTWFGKSEDDSHFLGLVEMKGHLIGFVQSENAFWEIVPIKADTSMVRELNIQKFNGAFSVDDPLDEVGFVANEIDLCDLSTVCGGVIDILVLITPDALEWLGVYDDPSNWWLADLYVAIGAGSFQTALINSGLEDVTVQTKIEGFDFVYDAFHNIVQDAFVNLPAQASGVRDELNADLVVLLTNRNYGNYAGAARVGELQNGYLNWMAPCYDCAYAIVRMPFLITPRWTFAHEVAHLFGARHNRTANVNIPGVEGDDADICTHAWRFSNQGGLDRTALALLFLGENSQRILHFSNPDIIFNDVFATGTDENNNAVGIGNATCAVRNYKQGDWEVYVTGPTLLCGVNGQVVSGNDWVAHVVEPTFGSVGFPPYTYEWRWNTTGNFSGTEPVIGTQPTLTIASPLACPQFFLQLTVTSADGLQLVRTRVVKAQLCTVCNQENFLSSIEEGNSEVLPVVEKNKQEDISSQAVSYTVFPNPTSKEIVIRMDEDVENAFQVSILGMYGQVFYRSSGWFQKEALVDLSFCPSQLVVVEIRDQTGHVFREKVIIRRDTE